ncbi:MAG: undecaprenyldiphospho-muramoylpentapeptide beta-N-acetylglucosaminyltransferase [Clostridia bacterium]|nr:undecaprenyldiphospho-muramoylpentapeptide beta-N-acetylglucosaminyltransferase [Clostridia bacterium]
MLSNKKILLTAGGTGGHVNPALAVAGAIRSKYPSAEILFVGTSDRIETKIVPAAGYELRTIEMSGFQRKLNLKNIKHNFKTVQRVLKSTGAVNRILDEFKPDVVVGFGGYVSGPVVRCAAKRGIPTAIHEQNAYPGVTNKALAKLVDKVMLTVPEAEKNMTLKNPAVVTGLPVRMEICEADKSVCRAMLSLDERPLVLSMGGSLGANTINEAMLGLITKLADTKKCKFIHATGQYGLWFGDRLKSNGVDFENNEDIEIREYINDMDVCMPAADLVICRAGASTISELQVTGKASILIPSPNVAENHQYHNAMALVRNAAAILIEEKDLTDETLYKTVNELLDDPEKLVEIGANARKMAITDATDRILDAVCSIIER